MCTELTGHDIQADITDICDCITALSDSTGLDEDEVVSDRLTDLDGLSGLLGQFLAAGATGKATHEQPISDERVHADAVTK